MALRSLTQLRSAALLGPALCLALLTAGCGQEEPDLVNGKRLFVGQGTCGSCHTLARADARGTQGPNLDEAFGPSRRDGLGSSSIAGVVENQIDVVRKSSIMPADLVTGDDARDVAAYVAEVAGVPGEDQGALARAIERKQNSTPILARGGTLEIPAEPSGALAFVSNRASAEAGTVQLTMPNPSPINHNIAVRGPGLDKRGPVVGTGGTSKVSVDLEAGRFEFYCSVPGHEEGGMRGQLTVE